MNTAIIESNQISERRILNVRDEETQSGSPVIENISNYRGKMS